MLYLIIGLIIGALIVYLYLHPKAQLVETQNDYLKEQELSIKKSINQLEYEKGQLEQEELELSKRASALESQKESLTNYITQLQKQANTINEHINQLSQQAQNSADTFYKQAMKIAEQRFDADLAQEEITFSKAQEKIRQEYLQTLQDCMDDYQEKIVSSQVELAEVNAVLADLKAKRDAAIAQAKRQVEIEQNQDFYRLQLSQLDVQEIEKIRSIIPYLRNAEPVNKVIWKVYYEKPYTDLIGRVIGSGTHCGIYKITNLQNQMCYVGQSVDLASRWKQHIRRGVGADSPTRNKLYPAMMEIGPENFTFEILEECPKAKLDEREDYWQDYYGAREYGYSIK